MGNVSCPLGSTQVAQGLPLEPAIDPSSLVLPPRPRQFPLRGQAASSPSREVSQLGRDGGECLLFLETARDVPYCDTLGDLTCQAVSNKSHGKPFVRAWAQREDGSVMGKVAEWPAKICNGQPSWYSAQSLGFPLADHARATLCVELRDDQMLLGSLQLPLRELPGHCVVTKKLERRVGGAAPKPCTVSFQILDSQELAERRTVFFVRHGESVWNKAQDSLHLYEMGRQTDHPLSAKGREQAEALSKRLAKAATQADGAAAQMLCPDAVYVSPLTRAVQTAVIALGPTLTKQNGQGELVLMANAREKQNFGGLDTMSTKIGADVVQNSFDELRALYEGEETHVLETFGRLRFDAAEVQDCWWCEGMAETGAQLEARLNEFMSQLLYSPHRSIVVVGHSHFFRATFRKYLSEEFKRENPGLVSELTVKKLMNCGVARVELDPSRGLQGPMVGVERVLGTRFDADGAGGGLLAGCCKAEQQAKGDESLSIGEDLELFRPETALRYETASSGPSPAAPAAQTA